LLGVTVLSDLVLLVVYAVVVQVTESQCGAGTSFDLTAFGALVGNLVACVFCGAILGGAVMVALWVPNIPSQLRGVIIIPTAWAFFVFSEWLADYTAQHWHQRVKLEPLIVLMIAGCLAGHKCENRRKFVNILAKSAPFVYVPFFTLTGIALDLHTFVPSLALAAILFGLRMLASRWCECSCDVHLSSLHSAHAHITIMMHLRFYSRIIIVRRRASSAWFKAF
jgi:hypothetical protein